MSLGRGSGDTGTSAFQSVGLGTSDQKNLALDGAEGDCGLGLQGTRCGYLAGVDTESCKHQTANTLS